MSIEQDLQSMMTAAEVEAAIREAVEAGKPLSVIRVGDGEGMILTRPAGTDTRLRQSVVTHFGAPLSAERADWLGERMEAAILSADIIGLRPEALLLNLTEADFQLDDQSFLQHYNAIIDAATQTGPLAGFGHQDAFQGALRLGHMAVQLARLPLPADQSRTHAWMHLELLMSGALARLVDEAPRLGMITCRRAVAARIVSHRKRSARTAPGRNRSTRFFQVPDKGADEVWLGTDPEFRWQSMKLVLDSLNDVRPGDVYLVGAGIWGKLFCDRIRASGGVALDIGSVWDAWGGKLSRPGVMPYFFQALGGAPDRVPEDLLIEKQLAELPGAA